MRQKIFITVLLMLSVITVIQANTKKKSKVQQPVMVTKDKLLPAVHGTVDISGYIGDKLELCIDNRVMAQKIEPFTMPYKVRDEPWWGWRGEFWGKWYTSAILGYGYRPTSEHRAIIDQAVKEIIDSQTADGYLGTSQADVRIDGSWDIWGRKYAMLGLIANYDMTGNKAALDAATKAAFSLISEVGINCGKNISETGWIGWKGLGSSSVLEPIVLLYQRTGEKQFLDFAQYIVDTWNYKNVLSPTGLQLIQGVIEGVPMRKLGGAPKAYEMTSCFEGLCELYRTTGNELYLEACKSFFENVMREEITIIGSGSLEEIWCNTKMRENGLMYEAMETCATTTWLKFLFHMLRITGESHYADAIETGLYNALLAAMTPNGDWWSYFTPLMGERTPSFMQFGDMHSSCCVVNGPRALLLTPYFAVMNATEGIALNLYAPTKANVNTPEGQKAQIDIATQSPRDGKIDVLISLPKEEKFTLKLRIPKWSKNNSLKINGKKYDGYLIPGTYASIERVWKSSDKVELELDMRTHVLYAPSGCGDQALQRGPIVMAFDSRLFKSDLEPDKKNGPMFRYEFMHNGTGDYVDAELVDSTDPNIWMTFKVPMKDESGALHYLYMCDFVSAGNLWGNGSIYRTWIEQPFDCRHLYPRSDWKINGNYTIEKPEIPEIYKIKK